MVSYCSHSSFSLVSLSTFSRLLRQSYFVHGCFFSLWNKRYIHICICCRHLGIGLLFNLSILFILCLLRSVPFSLLVPVVQCYSFIHSQLHVIALISLVQDFIARETFHTASNEMLRKAVDILTYLSNF